ncbi:hypothetical protein [Methylobacterium sp. V23]|uniref:hypothetical protein n=1 Tax=Methylobacterium sp. V23 TaxID=2044878 RepID=UPI0011AFFCE7|nr:hypothetical protein [Methylobacterium sp. V23]
MPPTKRQLAASLRVCAHIADRERIADFLAAETTQAGVNPFRQTSAGAQLNIWSGHSFEFRSSRTEVLGLGVSQTRSDLRLPNVDHTTCMAPSVLEAAP